MAPYARPGLYLAYFLVNENRKNNLIKEQFVVGKQEALQW